MDQSSPTQSDAATPSQSVFFWPPIKRLSDPPRRDTPAFSTQHGLVSSPQQESAQPSSSNLIKKERANFQAAERAAPKALLGKGNQGFMHNSNNNNRGNFRSRRPEPKEDNQLIYGIRPVMEAIHAGKVFCFSVINTACNKAVPASQGINEAFSTGSQNHQPPQPNSR